jgi:hypothetical protein
MKIAHRILLCFGQTLGRAGPVANGGKKNLGATNWVGAFIRSTEGSFMQLPFLYRDLSRQI